MAEPEPAAARGKAAAENAAKKKAADILESPPGTELVASRMRQAGRSCPLSDSEISDIAKALGVGEAMVREDLTIEKAAAMLHIVAAGQAAMEQSQRDDEAEKRADHRKELVARARNRRKGR